MRIETTRFADPESVEIDADALVTFPSGLPGFEGLRRFAVISGEDSPFSWLQSLDDATICFLVTDPAPFFSTYTVEISDEDAVALSLDEATEAAIFVILVVQDDPSATTANLLAPLVLNRRVGLGRQIVLHTSSYSVRTPLLAEQRIASGV